MKKKLISWILWSLLLSKALQGQVSESSLYKISYKDGSVYIGWILDKNDSGLELLIATGDTVHLNKLLIKTLEPHPKKRFHYERGYLHHRRLVISHTGLHFSRQISQGGIV